MKQRGVTRAGRGSVCLVVMICLLCTGCVLNRPPDYDSPAVAAVCATGDGDSVEVSFRGMTRKVTVDRVPSWCELYDACGASSGGACVNMFTNVIHMIDDRRCPRYASHELGHVFGVPGMDVPQRGRRF